jgi:ABC-2 type transport system ATP-binding protein
MAEADELCDRIAIINKGRIIAMDTPAAMKAGMTAESVIDLCTSSEHFTALKSILSPIDGKATILYKENTIQGEVSIHTAQPAKVIEIISPWLNTDLIQTMEMRSQTLEDVYVAIIQKEEAHG